MLIKKLKNWPHISDDAELMLPRGSNEVEMGICWSSEGLDPLSIWLCGRFKRKLLTADCAKIKKSGLLIPQQYNLWASINEDLFPLPKTLVDVDSIAAHILRANKLVRLASIALESKGIAKEIEARLRERVTYHI